LTANRHSTASLASKRHLRHGFWVAQRLASIGLAASNYATFNLLQNIHVYSYRKIA
jgi:hypothetical protein